MISPLLFLLAGVAGIGLFLSMIVHFGALVGQVPPLGGAAWGLHIGIFVVWFPAVVAMRQSVKEFKQKDLWKAALRGCPAWMRWMVFAFFAYAFANFALFMLTMSTGPGSGEAENGAGETAVFRGFSGHWMAFYSAAMGILYSAAKVRQRDPARRCPNGHLVPLAARFCEQCGAEVPGGDPLDGRRSDQDTPVDGRLP